MTPSDTLAAFSAARPERADDLEERLRQLAELAMAAAGDAACALTWRTANGDSGEAMMASSAAPAAAARRDRDAQRDSTRPGSNTRRDGIASAALAILSRRLAEAPALATTPTSAMSAALSAADIAEVLAHTTLPQGAQNGAHDLSDGPFTLAGAALAMRAGGEIRAVLIPKTGAAASQLKATLELLINGAFAEINAREAFASRAFWRTRAADSAAMLAGVAAESARADAAERELAAAYTAAAKLPPRRRFAGLGEILAQPHPETQPAVGAKSNSKSAPFDGWILAVLRHGRLEAVAASAKIALPLELAADSALARCLQSGAAAECAATHSTAAPRLFKRHHLCVPLGDAGAIALAARGGANAATRARAEALAARLAPLLKAWLVEDEAAEYRGLVSRLALRMFAAADDERVRIARDLHDDQAQLLAAAQIALAGGREQARAIFKELEDELRTRTRRLRPAALGHSSMAEALELEFERLRQARIRTRLIRGAGAARISRPVQQLSFQVAREALSNVMRHAEATSVTVEIGRAGGLARISISDNGRGMGAAAHAAGSGLAGLRERLELMGGTLSIDSRPGATIVIAEIPEPS